jgi:hypothetical protein
MDNQTKENLKGRFKKIYEIQDFDLELAEIDVYSEISELPLDQQDEAEEIWEDLIDEIEDDI